MSSWNKIKLGDVCHIAKGQQFNKIDLEKSGNFPCINGGINPSGYTDKWNTEANTITISEGGNSCGFVNFLQTRFWSGGHCYSLICLKDNIDVNFLYQALKGRESLIMGLRVGSGLPNIQLKAINEFEFEYPEDKSEQIRITQILYKSDSAIAKTEALIAKYKRIKTGLMQDLLTKGIDENGNIRNEKTHRFKTEKGLKVPEEWETPTVKHICSLRRGASPRPIEDPIYFSDSGRGWIRISDVTSSYKYLNYTEQYLSKYGVNASVKVDPGDLIMSICATIGKPVILAIEACIHDGFVYFDKLNDEINTEYLFYYLHFIEERIKEMKQTGTQGNLNTGIVNNIIIAKPSKAEQDSIVNILVGIDKFITQNINELNKLKLQKNGLMHDLLKGKVRVKTQDKATT